jgi:polyisoprenoid-binding protein YceI
MRKWWAWLLGVPVALVVVVSGGTWVYLNVIREPAPERLSLEAGSDAEAASDGATTTTTASDGASSSSTVDAGAMGVEGTWKVAAGSQAGYRVPEVLNGQDAEAVGRTNDVTGSLTIAGTKATAASFTVDMVTVASDESRRDNQFRGRIMDVASHPTSSFELASPIDFGAVPAVGGRVSAQASGRLTLKGATRSVTFALDAERTAEGFEVAGSIPITFADYGISNPSGGPAKVGDDGEMEFLVVFSK